MVDVSGTVDVGWKTVMKQGFIALLLILSTALPVQAAEVLGEVTINGKPAGAFGMVYLQSEGADPFPPEPTTATIIQKGFAFHPAFLIVTVGSTLRFENLDNEIHNAKSYSRPNVFDIGAHFPNTVKEVVLEKPGRVVLRCKVHHQMRGTVLVLSTRWFAEINQDGTFSIKGVPDGTYRLKTWLSGMDDREVDESSVEIELNGADPYRVRLDARSKHAVGPLVISRKNQNWEQLVSDMDSDLRRGFASWKNGQTDLAEQIVMTTYYEKFGGLGLRSLISQELGERRGQQLEVQFLKIAKKMSENKLISRQTAKELEFQIADLNRQLSIDLSRFSLDFP